MIKSSIVAALAFSSIGFASLAQAAPVQGHPQSVDLSVKVDYRDSASVKALYGRLARAARDVCSTGAIGRFYAQDSQQACVQRTLDSVVAEENRPILTAIHQSANPETRFAARGY